jgi:serine/threonine protein kinase
MMDVSAERVEEFECPVCSERIVPSVGPLERMVCPRCSSEVTVPARFGNFLLLEKMGDGMIGPVYRALDLTLNRQIALKVMLKVFAMNPQLVEAFRLQAAAAASILHPNIVTIYAFGSHAEHYHISMELIRGNSLHDLLTRGAIEERDLLNVAFRISEALQYAASSGMIHGDVRPRNVFIDQEGTPKIGDFGIAKAMADAGFRNLVWNSPYYTPPERTEGRDPDMRGDLYSLGATLYHSLCGRPPFDHTDPAVVMELKRTQTVPDIRTLDDTIHPATSAILSRLLERSPARRYPTHESLQGDLVQAIRAIDGESGGEPVPARTESRKAGSQKVGSQKVASQRMATQQTASQKMSSQKLRSQQLKSQQLKVAPAAAARPAGAAAANGTAPRKTGLPKPVLLIVAGLLAVGGIVFALTRGPGKPAAPATPSPTAPAPVAPGPAVPVDRQIAATPGLQLWLAADRGVEVAQGDQIAYWRDRGRKERAAEQSVPDLRPVFQRSALAGRPALLFENRLLACGALPGGFKHGTIFMVFRLQDSAIMTGDSERVILSIGTPEYALEHLVVTCERETPANLAVRFGRHGLPQTMSRTGVDRRWAILELHTEAGAESAVLKCSLNGSGELSEIVAYQSAATGPAKLWLGGIEGRDAFMRGLIAEVMVFDTPLSAPQRAQIGGYLAARHGISSRYPVVAAP